MLSLCLYVKGYRKVDLCHLSSFSVLSYMPQGSILLTLPLSFSLLQVRASRQGLLVPRHLSSPHGYLWATQGLFLHVVGCSHTSESPHGSGHGGKGCSRGFLPFIFQNSDVLPRNHTAVCVVTDRSQQSHYAGLGNEKCKPQVGNLSPLQLIVPSTSTVPGDKSAVGW